MNYNVTHSYHYRFTGGRELVDRSPQQVQSSEKLSVFHQIAYNDDLILHHDGAVVVCLGAIKLQVCAVIQLYQHDHVGTNFFVIDKRRNLEMYRSARRVHIQHGESLRVVPSQLPVLGRVVAPAGLPFGLNR